MSEENEPKEIEPKGSRILFCYFVDVLCLDKTGTLTDGNMSVDRIVPLGERGAAEDSDALLRGRAKIRKWYPLPMLATNVFIPYALIPYYGEKAILPNFRKRKTLQFKKDCNAF